MSDRSNIAEEMRFIDLGRIAYADALALQYATHARVLTGDEPPTVFVLEHEPVITRTRRAAAGPHLVADAAVLEADGIALADTDRGGDITYHGPGQLVVYPILPLQPLGLNVRRYVCALEQIVIDTLAGFGIDGRRDEAGIGVWVDGTRNAERGSRNEDNQCIDSELPRSAFRDPRSQKIAAIGVRVRRWVTLHGFAINVATDLAHFRHIVPCGLERPVTSMRERLGERCPTMQAVRDAVKRSVVKTFS